jgi:serine/threonine-protein kinase BUR1
MSASLPPKPKRPLSPSPADTTTRRVRQRTGTNLSSTVKPTPKKRDESPEEGEVEDEGEAPSVAHDDRAANGIPSANGMTNGTASKEDELDKEKAAAAGGKPKKVAFPFKSRAQKVLAIPTVDMENAPPSRPAIPLVSPSKGDYARGGSGSRHGFEENGIGASGRDSYVPSHSRGYDSYIPSRDRDRGSPKGGYERRRSWSPPHRDDAPDGHRRGRSKSPVETWDTYIAPKYQDPSGRMYKGRLADTYVAPGEGSPNQRHWQRSSSRGRGGAGADYYRPHADSPPRDRSPPERRSDRYSPAQGPHRLPPRPASPDRYAPPRHDDRPWNYGSRDQDWDRGYYPPRTPTRTPPQPHFEPPPLPTGDMGMDRPQRRISFSRGGDGAAVLLQQQQQQKQQPLSLPPRPSVPLVAKPQAVYTRPTLAPGPAAAPPVPPIEPRIDVVPPPSERQEKPKTSKHKVAQVRTKEEERAAYGREFVGSGRIKDYIILNKLGEGTFG